MIEVPLQDHRALATHVTQASRWRCFIKIEAPLHVLDL